MGPLRIVHPFILELGGSKLLAQLDRCGIENLKIGKLIPQVSMVLRYIRVILRQQLSRGANRNIF